MGLFATSFWAMAEELGFCLETGGWLAAEAYDGRAVGICCAFHGLG